MPRRRADGDRDRDGDRDGDREREREEDADERLETEGDRRDRDRSFLPFPLEGLRGLRLRESTDDRLRLSDALLLLPALCLALRSSAPSRSLSRGLSDRRRFLPLSRPDSLSSASLRTFDFFLLFEGSLPSFPPAPRSSRPEDADEKLADLARRFLPLERPRPLDRDERLPLLDTLEEEELLLDEYEE